MPLPSGFLDELRARVPIADVVGRRVRLIRSGREWKACCPFHNEKTPSFTVYKDRFHCFGCGADGDVVSFVMQSQSVSFPEAVEQLAAEAGLEVPRPTPAAAEAERQRVATADALAAAAAWFAERLWGSEGTAALSYLRKRGLADETIRRFGLGWSGDGRGSLAQALASRGFAAPALVEAGLTKPAEDGRPAAAFFFNRVMFPIRDRRGRVLSFGGRLLGDGTPKYVNGPETASFSKRRTLFGLDLAREGAARGASVVVVEGYMDVIALHQAGFAAAVAPLGTALTEEQLGELWRLSPAPILCFDGDAAGARAAGRAIETALPLLTPERTLRIATLPERDDPDTLVRHCGAGAFQAVLDAARPLADSLYGLLRERLGTATPEARAALLAALDAAASRIGDRTLAREYRTALRDRHYASVRRTPQGGPVKPRAAVPRTPLSAAEAADERARTLVAILLRHPALLHDVEEAFGDLTLPPMLDRLRVAILAYSDEAAARGSHVLDSADLMNHLTRAGLAADAARALAAVPFPLAASACADAMPAEAGAGWWHMFGLMNRDRLEQEVAAATRALAEHADAATQRRLIALRTAQIAIWQHDGDDAEA
ncbi:MAG: DNA primase [Acidisphaera sp.]|nr:DNA primase [Acidisphaera sp.]